MRLNPDSIPTSEQVRETLFDRYYYPYKKPILAALLLFAVAILTILGVREWRQRQQDEQWTRFQVAQSIVPDRDASETEVQKKLDERLIVLGRLVKDFPDASVTPYAMNEMLATQMEAKRYREAAKTLEELRTRFRDFPLNREAAPSDAATAPGVPAVADTTRTLADLLSANLRSEAEWTEKTTYVHPTPSADRTALVETTVGSFWIGFFPEHAPQHVENFVTLAKSGWFNGTQVYQASQNEVAGSPAPLSFEAGSANSKWGSPSWNPDPMTHDEDEPDALIEPEDARFTIKHRRGVVSSASLPSGESSRRFLVVAAASGLDSRNGRNTVFAATLDREQSLATIDRIALSPTYGSNPATSEHPESARMRAHPYPPIYIRRVSIWKDEKPEAGHTWDTSRAGRNEPEPWEAELRKPKMPEDFVQPPPAKDD